jgi:hypothetical protein
MPEVLLMVVGTIAIVLTAKFTLTPTRKTLAIATSALAILSLVKFQGLVAAVAIVLFVFWLTLVRKLPLTWAVKFGVLFVGLRISIGLLIAGPRVFGVTGSYIDSSDNSSSSTADLIPEAISLLPDVLGGTGLVFLIGFLGMSIYLLPITAMAKVGNSDNDNSKQLGALVFQASLFVFGALIALTIAFTVFVTLQGDSHLDRALLRYLEWLVIPFFLAVALLNRSSKLARFFLPLSIVGIAAISAAWYLSIRGQVVSSKISDSLFASSIIGGFSNLQLSLFLFFGFVIAVAITSVFEPTRLISLGVTCFLCLSLAAQNAWNLIDFRSGPNAADYAGQFARSFIGEKVEGSNIAILANTRFSATSAGIWLGKKGMYLPGGVVAAGNLPKSELIPNQDWLLSIGEVSLAGPKELVVSGQGFTITKFGNKNILYIGRISPQANVVIADESLAYYSWGAIPVQDTVDIQVIDPAKASNEIIITAKINEAVAQGNYSFVLVSRTGAEREMEIFTSGVQQFNFSVGLGTEGFRLFVRDSTSGELAQGLFGLISIETR